MSNWDAMIRTHCKHGNFLGRSQAEQDDFYSLFGNPQPSVLAALAKGLQSLLGWTGKSLANLAKLALQLRVAGRNLPRPRREFDLKRAAL